MLLAVHETTAQASVSRYSTKTAAAAAAAHKRRYRRDGGVRGDSGGKKRGVSGAAVATASVSARKQRVDTVSTCSGASTHKKQAWRLERGCAAPPRLGGGRGGVSAGSGRFFGGLRGLGRPESARRKVCRDNVSRVCLLDPEHPMWAFPGGRGWSCVNRGQALSSILQNFLLESTSVYHVVLERI